MHILFIAPFGTCCKQTVQRRMVPLAQGLVNLGHTLELLIPAWDCPKQAGQVQLAGGVTLRYPRLGPAPHRGFDLALVRRMLAAAHAFKPDIVHAFKPIGYSGALALLLKRQRYQVFVDSDDLESEAGWGQKRRLGLRQLVGVQERWVLHQADGVSVASIYLQEYSAAIRSTERSSQLYLPNGLDLASEPALVASNPPIVLLYTRGNDVSSERVRKLWSHIVQRMPKAKLRIIGDWGEAPALLNCEHLGLLEGQVLIDALRSAALALFPVEDSLLVRAKSPARLLDCLAHGLPIVTEDIGEYGSLAGTKATHDAGDDDGIVETTVNLLQDHQLRREYADFSWQQVQLHTWERRVESLLTWYKQTPGSFVQPEGKE